MKTRFILSLALLGAMAPPAFAQLGPQTLTQKGGEAIYKGVCQDCHMPDGKGAVGAGMYPSLAGNEKLEEAGYPLSVVINGLHSMPSFATSASPSSNNRWIA